MYVLIFSIANSRNFISFLRHLRFLIRTAEEAIQKVPTLTSIQNEATVSKAVVSSMQSELASLKQQRGIDHAKSEEEKDGRLNEKYVLSIVSFQN